MISANILILTIVLASVFAVGIAHADDVIVDLPNRYNPESQLCNEGTATGDWFCNWKNKLSYYTSNQTTVESGEIPYTWDEELKEYVPTEEFEAQAIADCKARLTCPSGNYQYPNGTIVNFDELIEESQPTPIILPDENVYICANDIALYQGGHQFEVPIEIWFDEDGKKGVRFVDDNSIRATSWDKKDVIEISAVEACFAQWDLEIRDNIDTRSIVSNEDDIFFYHGDIAQFIPPIGQKRVNDMANKDRAENLSIHDIVCNGFYEHMYKKSMGCFTDFPEGDEKPTIANTFSEELKAMIDQYNRDGGEQMAKDRVKDLIAEKLASLNKLSRAMG